MDTLYQSPTITKQSVPYTGTSPNLFTTTTVNPSARTTTVTAPDNISTTTVVNGLVTTVTDARGNSTTSTSDVWGRVLSVTPPTGPSVSYTYDELDRLLTATRGGAVTSIKYDNAGRKINMDDPDMGKVGTPTDASWAWSYGYDALGNLTSQTDARGCTLTLGYDSLSRLSSKSSSGTGCVVQVSSTYSYDSGTNGKGYRTGMTDASGSATWTYDTRGRMTSEAKTLTGASTYTTSWTYNAADLPITQTYPDGETVTTGYNDRMLLNSVTGTNTYVSSTNYDTAGRITSRALGNTLTQNFTYYGWTETATVDSAAVGQGGRLKNTTVGSIQNLSYVYDAVGNIRTITDSLLPETQSYGYDTLDRLTSANVTGALGYSQTYAYNATSGNLTAKGSLTLNYADSNHVHAVTGAGSNTYSYDANGNQTTRVIGADTYNLKYDAENRLVEVKKNNNVIATFTFDGDGKRVKSVINGTTTLFVGAGFEIKNPGAGQEVTKYYFAGASRVAMRKYVMPQSPTVNYMLYDHLGSTNITTDTNGAVVTGLRYRAWGEVRYPTNGTNPGPSKYTYTGQYSNVDDFGLMFYNARWYDSVTGRFTQPDTIIPDIDTSPDWDRYSYVRNNPIRYDDPTGHCPGVKSGQKCVANPKVTTSSVKKTESSWWGEEWLDWLMPIAGGPVIHSPQITAPLQQNATATAQPKATATAQATATPDGWHTVEAWRGLDSAKQGDIRRGIKIDDPSDNEPLGGMSVFEASNPQSLGSRYTTGLPFYISYQGNKSQGTPGIVYGILPNNTEYAFANGVAMYTPNAGGEGHWTITITGMTKDQVKRTILDYAEQYFNTTIPFPITP